MFDWRLVYDVHNPMAGMRTARLGKQLLQYASMNNSTNSQGRNEVDMFDWF